MCITLSRDLHQKFVSELPADCSSDLRHLSGLGI